MYRGKPFAGPSGQMLDDYLLAAGIDRANCYVTNVVRTFEGTDDVTDAEIERDIPALKAELLKCQPRFIGLLGRVAVDVMLPSVPDRELYWMHGLQFEERMPWGWVKLLPCYHPAAGLHSTGIQGATAWDFEQFGRMVRGEVIRPYKENNRPSSYHEMPFSNGGLVCYRAAVDTEGPARHPWCVSWCGKSGEAIVNRHGKIEFGDVILHHSLHDLAVLRAMGIIVGKFEDTMLKAALLGTEPHGLKDLARRHLGMKLRHYDDLVRDARRVKAINYLGEVIECLLRAEQPDANVAESIGGVTGISTLQEPKS